MTGPIEHEPSERVPIEKGNAKQMLRWVALFLGELRDGLTMINMQSAFLITSKHYSEKQAGILFFVFGMSQFLFQTPAGYLMDYSDRKVLMLSIAAVTTTVLTVFTAIFASDYGNNLLLMVLVKFLQGAITALIPPGLNSITQGIVGSVGMTKQVSRNEMMNHLGTAIIVLTGSLLAFGLYPNIGLLFVVSPIACAGVVYFLNQIKPEHIDHDAARGLVLKAKPEVSSSSIVSDTTDYKPPTLKGRIQTKPSYNFGFGGTPAKEDTESPAHKADSPLSVLRDPVLVTFTFICFMFHTANGCILPLVMQSLALEGGRSAILLSGLCIIVAQVVMVATAKICGDYSGKFGRKPLFVFGLSTVAMRCLILFYLISKRDSSGSTFGLQLLILSTQIFDGIGAGTFGTMYILVTSDISGGTGRFSFTLGITTAAMSIGGTVSGYLGEALAEDLGYRQAFVILGVMSLIPTFIYIFFMPETLPSYNPDAFSSVKKITSMKSIREEDEKSATEQRIKKGPNYVELV